MSKDELHTVAESTTPQAVEIPKTYIGLFVWALGKWGVGIVFAAFLIPVYTDLKVSNQRLADISTANVMALNALASKIEQSNVTIQRLDDVVRRVEIQVNQP